MTAVKKFKKKLELTISSDMLGGDGYSSCQNFNWFSCE